VNQEKFPKTLKNITSLKLETSIEFDLDELLKDLLLEIKNKLNLLATQKRALLEKKYTAVLYKKNIPTMFKNNHDEIFLGMIIGISENGNIQIQLANDSIEEFGIKEISLL
jgi:BirA family biotin operon repressor/biotin-[acetyl-CoA-carboxylase] ligase